MPGASSGDRNHIPNPLWRFVRRNLRSIITALANRNHNENDYRYEQQPNYSYGYAPDQVVRCESRDNQDQYCAARIGRGRVEIQRQLSKSACRFNSSWGYDRHGIWVNQGCRADFAVLR